MNINQMSRASVVLFLVALAGCGKGEQAQAGVEVAANAEASVGVEAAVGADAVVEEHEGGAVALSVAPDGNVRAAVSGPDNKPIRENISGTLVWKASADAEAKTIPLTVDAKTGLLVAAGPKLEADLSEINYTISVNAKPWSGSLHVPVGGTAALVAGAKASAEIKVPAGKVGPNGGVIQVVGKDRVELVSDESSGEVRVYVLDADFHVVPVGERSITLGVVAEGPRTIALARADAGAFFVAKWSLAVDPLKVTIALRDAVTTSVALVGYMPGARLIVEGPRAPRLKVRVKTQWVAARVDGEVDADAKVRAKADGKNNGWGDGIGGGRMKGDDRADIDVKHVGGGHAKADVKVDVKVGGPSAKGGAVKADVKAKAGAKAGGGGGGGKGKGH